MKKIIYLILVVGIYFTSCDLYEEPQDAADKDAIFSSQAGLQTYAYSFYNMLPSGSDLNQIETDLVDFGAINNINTFISKNSYSETSSSGWSWTDLRNINYFIENCTNEAVSETVRNNYIGIARFFRAWFYYDKVTTFGDVPWIDKPLDIDDEELYAARNSRELVMEKVYEDLQFACNNITTTTDATGSLVTKWVAYAMAARVCLFEGTFRKYHNLSLTTPANTWLQRAVTMSEYLMNNSGKKLYTATGVKKSYRALFTNDNPLTDEILMAACSNSSLGVLHHANWKWTSPTYGNRFSMTRSFINTYLQLNGTPYTSKTGWETEAFYDECQNRDYRLSQTIRTPGYTRDGEVTAPDFAGYVRTGYQPMKLCVDGKSYDNAALNTNALPYFRYAEVLLVYAEAKAELGTLTDADWAKTIGALRSRAGITGGISTKPTTVDSYLKSYYFPNISDPSLLEIRRERAIELCLEGFRFDDLRRWKCGDLLLKSWYGMYVPQLNVPIDLDKSGTYDVIFYTSVTGLTAAKALTGDWNTAKTTCATIYVEEGAGSSKQLQLVEKVSGASGYYLTWDKPNDYKRVWGNKQYLYPIPSTVMVKNPNIVQNTGWENGGTNDGN
ncbi:MAG: starch-binding protein [Bacteroidetes bacterium GWF2_42_66]|nr:MAG: starch-binding protein [Bacteroidetes bacterium GWA2_42_15]OFY01923.1 MAG: starch-binding protein [Bacteroidetes bacterium GWE2_42_39]OFY44781.1 MAG: starch-binding protein [Bacteroidetes bacterium GWF2_42_66]HBL75906.1 RagB/SusD family nutrient uptake outer membrane protein [Prolixibacteraceae bacterium]HCU62022.1 RagB/SusD family nutrient uptake outer membrane protein [Prolixibacteraceae bacterium]